MKLKLLTLSLLLILACGVAGPVRAQKPAAKKPASSSASVLKSDKEELEAVIALAPAERIEKLKDFMAAHPRSPLKRPAQELLVSAHAALGDEKLKAGDAAGGAEQFRLAIVAIPTVMSDNLFTDVVSQIPSNLFLRGQQTAAIDAAHSIEDRIKDNPKRLLAIAAFYVGIEAADDALRTADLAIKLAPDASAAYQARASAHRIALRLEESAADYARALELDPKSDSARRSLAELRRATGKTEEALALYRELLVVNPADEFARTGLVVSLFELGKKEEAERELDAALKENPNGLALLTGLAYWFAAHNESTRAIELAKRAAQIEPRYTWAHIALARGLLEQKRPMDAERALLVARKYGRFPTLDYEMASVLAAAGLYGEAVATLSTTFAIKADQVETYLAGRTLAHANSFTELLAPERRASIFQFTAADNETNARSLKALLTFAMALNPPGGREAVKEADVAAAAREFMAGADEMRAFRRLYVASRLLEADIALPMVLELTDGTTNEVETALNAPIASIAVMADDLRGARAQANAYDSVLNVPEIPRNTLANIMRGRIEDLAGWTLFHQGKYVEAVVRLRRATSVLPDKSVWWRNSMWHLGASLDASNNATEALEVYYKSYRGSGADPTRRAVIESLYRRVNGSLDGLEDKIGPSSLIASNAAGATNSSLNPTGVIGDGNIATSTSESKRVETTPPSEPPSDAKPVASESKPTETAPANNMTSDPKAETGEPKPAQAAPKSDAVSEPQASPSVTKPAEAPRTIATESKTDSASVNPSNTLPKGDSTSEPEADKSKSADTSAPPAVVLPVPELTPTPTQEATPTPTPEAAPTPTPTEVPLGPPPPAVNDEPPAGQTNTVQPTAARPAPDADAASKQRKRRVSENKCAIIVSETALTIQNNGGRALVSITLNGAASPDGVTAVTSDWSSLAVFPEPKSGTDISSLSYSVTSISKKTGTFTITFKSPCGSKEVIVTVK